MYAGSLCASAYRWDSVTEPSSFFHIRTICVSGIRFPNPLVWKLVSLPRFVGNEQGVHSNPTDMLANHGCNLV